MAIDYYGKRRRSIRRSHRRQGGRWWAWLLAALLVLVGGYVGWQRHEPVPAEGHNADGGLEVKPEEIVVAKLTLGDLMESDAASILEYQRAAFGPAWADVDRNGCDTRNDILQRDLTEPRFKPGTHDCVVISGHLLDPYSGVDVDFVKGNKTSTEVQIDHIVPLALAWRSGAWAWTDAQRKEFANSPEELVAVAGAENQAKGDKGPADWLPKVGHCGYVVRYVRVMSSWNLAISDADRQTAERVLENECPAGAPSK